MFFDDDEKEEPKGFFGELASLFEWDKEDTDEEKRVKELKNLGLDDEEIRLVIEEGYDPCDFEDDIDGEREDDDYYGEDF